MACPPQAWDGVVRRLAEELPAFAVEAWLRPLEVESGPEGVRLLCPSPLHRRRLLDRFLPRIREGLTRELGRPVAVKVEVRAAAPQREVGAIARRVQASGPRPTPRPVRGGVPAPLAPPRPTRSAPALPAPPPGADPTPARQRTLPYSFDSFVVGEANALAREAAFALARGGRLTVSPLFLAAPSGLGKTHLASAVLTETSPPTREAAVYASAEQFTNELGRAIRTRRTAEFKQRFRERCRLLILEDVQFVAGKQATQLELFHTLEALRDRGTRIVLSADRLPREIEGLEPRLSSRLASGLVAEIGPPGPELRRAILRAKAAAGGVRVPAACLERLVEAVPGNVRDLEGALIQLVASAALLKRPIDLELTEEALRKVRPQPRSPGRLEPGQVIRVVASFFRTTPDALARRSRRRDVLVPRQLAMYLCRRYTDASLKEIGRCLGRDHPAVANAVAAVERRMLERAPLRYQIEALAAHLEGAASGGE